MVAQAAGNTRGYVGEAMKTSPHSLQMKTLQLAILIFAACTPLFAAERKHMNEVRTYMSFTYPVDPVKIQIIPDMDMSYALAATLIEWDAEKQISAALAESWKIVSTNVYRFTIRKNATWSDGNPVRAAEVKTSFERGMKSHPDDLRSLIQMLDVIECPSDHEIDFKLKVPARESGLLGKLTEPNFGILKIDEAGKIDLSATTGAFFLSPESNRQQLTLVRNSHWHRYDSTAPAAGQIIVRRSPHGMDAQNTLFTDTWPNLIETSSLIKADLLTRYESEKYEIWKRPVDKVFYLHLGKKAANAEGRSLIRFLRQKLNTNEVVAGLSGYTVTTQMFPRGYQLHELDFSYPKSAESLSDLYKRKAIDVLISPARVNPALQENIRRAIVNATGVEPHFISAPLEEVSSYKVRGEFDIYAGTVGLADPDPEGIMSFYLEGDTPLIHPIGNDFLARLDAARKEMNSDKKLTQMLKILHDALCDGYLLPLFHLSTVGIGRKGLDFSQIPSSDESVTLSKIRFREAQ